MSKKKKIVVIGGGTGVSVLLSGLKRYHLDLTAIVTMFDSGGSSGKLRAELGIAPVGDIRQCLVTLSPKNKKDLSDLFNYRFETGSWLKGHNLGNLLIAGATKIAGSLQGGINKIIKILNIKSRIEIFPISLENADIVARLKDSREIKGEENIINCAYLSKIGINKLYLNPEVKVNQNAISAIEKADLIIFAPGKFYTSILPNLLVKRVPRAIRRSRAEKVFVCNLMTQVRNTDGFSVGDFLNILEKYLGKGAIDYVIFNTGKLSSRKLKKVKNILPKADFVKYNKDLLSNKNYIGADILDKNIHRLNPFDTLIKGANQRTMVFHDSKKLAKIILKLCKR